MARFLNDKELQAIEEIVVAAEKLTSGEIRVVIKDDLDKDLGTPREQALREFYLHGLDKTKDQTGVLLLIVVKHRAIEVLGDIGINEKVPHGTWDSLVRDLSDEIRKGNKSSEICQAVTRIGQILKESFPHQCDDADELPDAVIVEEGEGT